MTPTKPYKYAVFIGRMQPPHNGHINIIRESLIIAEQIIVVLGSTRSAPSPRNPFTFEERKLMISNHFGYFFSGDNPLQYINIVEAKDYFYNDNIWLTGVQESVKSITGECNPKDIVLVGHEKDHSSEYLNWFPQWDKKFDFPGEDIHATDIRDYYFKVKDFISASKDKEGIFKQIPNTINHYLADFYKTSLFEKLADEYQYYQDYKKQWTGPFDITFITTDVVLIKSGHVLLVRRKVNPGKGLLALPGGFLNKNEWIEDSAFRELKEETKIKVDKKVLKEYIRERKTFDHPERSMRGRTITEAFYVKLPDTGPLPEVRGADDAKEAHWVPLADLALYESEMFEDHLHIIAYFMNRG